MSPVELVLIFVALAFRLTLVALVFRLTLLSFGLGRLPELERSSRLGVVKFRIGIDSLEVWRGVGESCGVRDEGSVMVTGSFKNLDFLQQKVR